VSELERRAILRSRTQQQGKQFGGAQRLDAEVDEAFTGAVGAWQLADGKSGGIWHLLQITPPCRMSAIKSSPACHPERSEG
jgi:hypothetical protein